MTAPTVSRRRAHRLRAISRRARNLRPVHPGGWWPDAAMVAGFLAVTAALAWPAVRDLDLAIRDLADTHRPVWADAVTLWIHRLGSGGLLTTIALIIALVLGWRRRSIWPVAPVLAAFTLTGIAIMPIKVLTHRAAPHSPLPDGIEVRLFSQPEGLSYPSGHAVNTVVWYGVICLLLASWLTPWMRRWLRWAPPAIVVGTATYLGFHWLTDMLAGLCLGVLIDRAIRRIPWPGVAAGPDVAPGPGVSRGPDVAQGAGVAAGPDGAPGTDTAPGPASRDAGTSR